MCDPLRLSILHASFQAADSEFKRRAAGLSTVRKRRARSEAARLSAALYQEFEALDEASLKGIRERLAGAFLREFDKLLAVPGSPPGERVDTTKLSAEAAVPAEAGTSVGLVSLPWMSPALPSIQLATLASSLQRAGIPSEVHELYVDYAARIGLNFYNLFSNLLGYLPEWVFSRHYYGPETGDWLDEMRAQRPFDDIPWPEYSDAILCAFDPVTSHYLDDMIASVDWSRYDVIGCSLTISQLGASMAFARKLKLAHPAIKVVFGGSQCAGAMGRAILRICPYVDAVVHIEGELVFPELVRRLRIGLPIDALPGVSSRINGEVVTGPQGGLNPGGLGRLPLSYDSYFRRLMRLDLLEKMNPWLPFEGSRGCWWGQKFQCTFCGLHEIMEFRAWDHGETLAELERLFDRYKIGRFYAMDLILPRDFIRTFLPEVARRNHDWMFFWEIKSNMRREELAVLAEAGVRWVQPGIESLDTALLDLMKKGVSAMQNIQLLKWCGELSIFCGWNLLCGLPGETAASYQRMAEIIPKIHHLQPPSGGGRFQLHRFSPYFDHPENYGIRWAGAHPMFRYAFPVPESDLNELVYLHEFELASGAAVDTAPMEEASRRWRAAHHAGVTMTFTIDPDGSGSIEDGRRPHSPKRIYRLTPEESRLYVFLDGAPKRAAIERNFPASLDIDAVLARWLSDDLILSVDDRFFSLAHYYDRPRTDTSPRPPGFADSLIPISTLAPTKGEYRHVN